ncbi:uncharacterized protein LOC119080752 isoform X2 [Bradysia coprophila]|uniref:uncharacterized protein LOC119080752 isoform X2 n=1 Tax=Bradysia coprophila TaxID=38358 RepID=UPI00187DA49D|nr:uncharacterized protein LOC119080752 isoform X2 [Bradysia coprophila]
MSSIVTKFGEYVDSQNERSDIDQVDLSQLAAHFNSTTPLQLRMNSNTSASELATVILINLNKYAPNNAFPLVGLKAVNKIIRKDVNIEDVFVQQILLIHLTKMNLDVMKIARTMAKLDRLTLDFHMDERLEEWEAISKITIKNKHIRYLIDKMITDTFGNRLAEQVFITKDYNVVVAFVSTEVMDLRGFSGFNTIYINKNHFDGKVNSPQWSSDLILIDVVTVTVHELAHVRCRQVFDDLNASSPILTTGLPVNDPEFGRIVERKVFGAAVDWDDSTSVGRVPVSHVTNLLDAIRQNTTLPSPPPGATLYERLNPVKFYGSAGADISQGGMSQ